MLNYGLKRCIIFALIVLGLDQASKLWVLQNISRFQKINLFPSLNLVLAKNTGIAFGMMHNAASWQRIIILGVAVLVSIIILKWSSKLKSSNKLELFSLSMILGGALGNLIDRLWHGYVVDFIDFYIGSWHWYTFNIADIAICLGAAFLILPIKKISSGTA